MAARENELEGEKVVVGEFQCLRWRSWSGYSYY